MHLQLFLRQNERLVSDIAYGSFPILYRGEEGKIEFNFVNSKARQAFSFHLMGEGKDAAVRLEQFNVTIEQNKT